MKKLNFLWLGLLALVITSCGSGDGKEADYLPMKLEKGGKWGMVSPEGKVLFSEEFEHEPTLAYNGRFLVKNADGLWEIYTTDEKPKKVGKEYKSAGVFIEKVAPVVEKGRPIDFIDRDGDVKFTLKDVDGKPVEWVRNFCGGLAIFATEAGQGAIDPSGDVVLKPSDYCTLFDGCSDGKLFAVEAKYAETYDRCGTDSVKICVIDKKGKKLFEFNGDKYATVSPFVDGKSIVSQKNDDGDVRYGIIDEKGEWVVKPSSKFHRITAVMGDNFIYYDGDNYGLMSLEGEVLLRAKYDALAFAAKDRLVVGSFKDSEWKIIDLDGNDVGKDTYEGIAFGPELGGNGLAKEGKDSYLFIDKDGNALDAKQSFYELGDSEGDYRIESDFTDIPALVGGLKLSANGLAGITFGMKVADVFNAFGESLYPSYTSYGSRTWTFMQESQKCDYKVVVGFNGLIVDRRSSGWWSYSYYTTEAAVERLAVGYSNSGRLDGKLDEVYKQLQEVLKGLGAKETAKEAAAVKYDLGGKSLLLAKSDSEVVLELPASGMLAKGLSAGMLAGDSAEMVADSAAVDTVAVAEDYD